MPDAFGVESRLGNDNGLWLWGRKQPISTLSATVTGVTGPVHTDAYVFGMNEKLNELLAETREASCVFGGGLSNHLPMALIALARLGASAERLGAYAEAYVARLDSAGPDEVLQEQMVVDAIARYGVAVAVPALVSELADGLAGSAFHEIIHLAYALEHGGGDEVANALGHWKTVYRVLDLPPAGGGDRDVRDVLAEIQKRSDLRPPKLGGLIIAQLGAAATVPGFAEVVATARYDDSTIGQLAAAGLAAFLADPNIITVHMLTGAHAVRIIKQHMGAPGDAVAKQFWPAFAAAYTVIGAPALDRDAREAVVGVPNWEALRNVALASDDEHVIKSVYSCRQESRVYGGDAQYRLAAARYAGL